MERRSDKPRTGHLPKGKAKNLTNLTFAFPGRNHQVNKTSTSDFQQTILHRTATFDARNGLVVPMSDRGTRALVVAKEGTGANTARIPDTETKVEGMKIDNEFSHLSNDYTIQEFEFEKGNNYPSVNGRLKKNFIFWQETLLS